MADSSTELVSSLSSFLFSCSFYIQVTKSAYTFSFVMIIYITLTFSNQVDRFWFNMTNNRSTFFLVNQWHHYHVGLFTYTNWSWKAVITQRNLFVNQFLLWFNLCFIHYVDYLKMKWHTYNFLMKVSIYTQWFFETGRILFFNSSKTKWATIKYDSSKEAEIYGLLFDTCDEKIW